MQNKFTSGEWNYVQSFNEGDFDIVGNDTTLAIVRVFNAGLSLEEGEANAKLIADSPKMFTIIEAIKARINGDFDNEYLLPYGSLSVNVKDDINYILNKSN